MQRLKNDLYLCQIYLYVHMLIVQGSQQSNQKRLDPFIHWLISYLTIRQLVAIVVHRSLL